jgi:sulfur carrier protein
MIFLNGESSDLQAGETVAQALARLDLSIDAQGVAIAVDGQVVPRSIWETFTLSADARIEVLTAMQGG